jgi:hypothetical protein
MEHRAFVVHTSVGEVEVFLSRHVVQIVPLENDAVAQKEPFEEYNDVATLADALALHAELPSAEARRVAEELLSRRAVMVPLRWRFWRPKERSRAKALFEFSSI